MLYLLRHGATEGTEKRLYYGRTDLPLSETGKRELLGKKEAGGYPDIRGCAVYTSGMLRTEQTLRLLYPGVGTVCEPKLREMDFGVFEMRGYEELKSDPQYRKWISGDYLSNVCPGGESSLQQKRRVEEALHGILRRESGDVLLVTHGGTIAIIMDILFPETAENRWHWQCGPGEGFAVSVTAETGENFWRIPDLDE